ncbi:MULTISPECIES: GPR1/FUN34/YaaH family transporter [unclassified Pseudonocardia]|jgi:hypothetical protein|uniref:GPR1/FUN34/YaaH family transporter n=1 Tax=unclassified Pseudonocardia TaxID=2619320 RepID=UPI001ACD52EF|nr:MULTISPECIES: GPR1/FUN34/YaaH family transporter [unclassified Pseudonocardia]MBN9098420.1 hypothetical protein [Pseudonocardia sp.]
MSVESDVQSGAHASAEPAAAAPVANPALLGLATFLPGAISLGLWLVGYLPAASVGGIVPAVVFSSGLFLLVSTVWCSRIGNGLVGAIFGIFSAFWLSLGVLLAAETNGWLGLTATTGELPTYLISWLVVFVALTLATLRLPLAFTAGFLFVDIAVALVLAFALSGTAIYSTLAGIAVFVFCAIFAYIWFDGVGQELGGKAMAMGSPMQK